MMFEIEIIGQTRPASPLRPAPRAGIILHGQARFAGERVSVDWATARHLIANGRAKPAPGVVIPLVDPEARR